MSHQSAVLFFQNKSATSNQPTIFFSQNKSASTINHQPNEQGVDIKTLLVYGLISVASILEKNYYSRPYPLTLNLLPVLLHSLGYYSLFSHPNRRN
jgi:hypothetical protein